jgi:hypothetical protein
VCVFVSNEGAKMCQNWREKKDMIEVEETVGGEICIVKLLESLELRQ